MAVNFTGITFSLLRWLTLTPYGHLWMDLLLLVLNISPKLRFLKIQYVFPYRPGSLPLSWKKPSYVPKCLSSSLEIFLWEKYRGSEEDKQLTRYILANSNCLKKAKIIFTSTFLLEEKETMEKELEAMPRVSMMSQLLCE
ncbi:hypothetical protein AALP_AA4G049500 [Arabis alpina]|uniref:FBD domain-containing protein n=1 Tax=Arabis alpina TaxID=50452 RepID=A0A087H183_ARAAL|nr:hypothetical protein AALP_AA4G049500 [Arabis alpina]